DSLGFCKGGPELTRDIEGHVISSDRHGIGENETTIRKDGDGRHPTADVEAGDAETALFFAGDSQGARERTGNGAGETEVAALNQQNQVAQRRVVCRDGV